METEINAIVDANNTEINTDEYNKATQYINKYFDTSIETLFKTNLTDEQMELINKGLDELNFNKKYFAKQQKYLELLICQLNDAKQDIRAIADDYITVCKKEKKELELKKDQLRHDTETINMHKIKLNDETIELNKQKKLLEVALIQVNEAKIISSIDSDTKEKYLNDKKLWETEIAYKVKQFEYDKNIYNEHLALEKKKLESIDLREQQLHDKECELNTYHNDLKNLETELQYKYVVSSHINKPDNHYHLLNELQSELEDNKIKKLEKIISEKDEQIEDLKTQISYVFVSRTDVETERPTNTNWSLLKCLYSIWPFKSNKKQELSKQIE